MSAEDMSIDLRLAAIICLLSSAALRGATAGKTEALQAHLAAAATEALPPHLKRALQQTLAGWQGAHCQPTSVAVDLRLVPAAGQALH